MKNENIEDLEIEDILKMKMNELSYSVDCFDRISARAFPQEKNEFSEDGYVISDLENITGRSRKPNIIKWTAAVAAAVVCIAVLPKTGFVRNVFYHIGSGSVKKSYQQLITEINTELETGNYTTFDIPLEQYIKNDVLITPLFSCPFESCDKEDANVRLFIKQINGINTTQMYAALYCGTYTENNIIAAAESDFKFTSQDMTADIFQTNDSRDLSLSAANELYESNEAGQLVDKGGNIVSLASCSFSTVVKDDSGVHKVTSELLYGHNDETKYFYDIITYNTGSENKDTIELPERNNMWRKSIYYNGNSAFPEESASDFVQAELFESLPEYMLAVGKHSFVYPFAKSYYSDSYENDDARIDREFIDSELILRGKDTGYNIASVVIPNDILMRSTLKIFYSPTIFRSENGSVNETGLVIKDKANKLIETFKSQSFDTEEDLYKNIDEQNKISEEEIADHYEQLLKEIDEQRELQEKLRLEEELRQQEETDN